MDRTPQDEYIDTGDIADVLIEFFNNKQEDSELGRVILKHEAENPEGYERACEEMREAFEFIVVQQKFEQLIQTPTQHELKGSSMPVGKQTEFVEEIMPIMPPFASLTNKHFLCNPIEMAVTRMTKVW